jgi:hypothetical protein
MPITPSLKRMNEGGLQKRLQKLYWWQSAQCKSDRAKSIRLRDVGVVFLCVLMGLLASSITLLCECASKYARRTAEKKCIVVRAHHDIRRRKIMAHGDGRFSLPYID